MSMTIALDAQFVERGGPAMIFAQCLQLKENFLLGYCFESLCDRIALAHEPSKFIALEQGCDREINMQAIVPSHSYESYDSYVSYVLGLRPYR